MGGFGGFRDQVRITRLPLRVIAEIAAESSGLGTISVL